MESNEIIDKEQLRLAFQQGAIAVINKKKLSLLLAGGPPANMCASPGGRPLAQPGCSPSCLLRGTELSYAAAGTGK